jgi:hypothetical protein
MYPLIEMVYELGSGRRQKMKTLETPSGSYKLLAGIVRAHPG